MEDDHKNGVDLERSLTVLYATQTGNAQDLAESLARRAIRQHFTAQCLSMEDYSPVPFFAPKVRADWPTGRLV